MVISDAVSILFTLVDEFVPEKHQPLLYDPASHEPRWHQYSLIGHVFKSLETALRFRALTGINVGVEAILHDAGKLKQFGEAMRRGRPVSFIGHEPISATIARRLGLNEESQLLIRHHDISYRLRHDRVLGRACRGQTDLLPKLLVLAAVDTVAKGWTQLQVIQRPEVAKKFRLICQSDGLSDELAPILDEAIRTW